MTQTFNNFRQLFLVVNRLKQQNEKTETANSIAVRARELSRQGEEEFKHAATAEGLIQAGADENLKRSFEAIAAWHHTLAAKKFREAAALFARIKNYGVRARVKEHFNRKASEMISRAAGSEAASLGS